MDLKQELIEKEKALLTRPVRSSVAQLRQLLSEAFFEIGTSGVRTPFAQVLDELPKYLEWTAEISEVECRLLSDSVAQVTYRAEIRQDAAAEPTHSIRTSIWRQEPGGWKMVFHQGTRLATALRS